MSGTVIYCRHALHPDQRTMALVSSRMTIADMAPNWRRAHIALCNGVPVLREDWPTRHVCNGDVLIFVDAAAIPQGGGDSSNPLRVVLMVVVAVAAVYTGGLAAGAFSGYGPVAGSLAGGLASAGVMMAGGVLVNALAPVPTASLSSVGQMQQASPTYSLQAQGNSARIEGAIPEHFGRHVAYPDYASTPYQEFIGNEQYLYSLLCLGRGSYHIEGIYIEDTPITNFEGVNLEVVGPGGSVTMFPAQVTTSVEVAGQDLEPGTYSGPFVVNDEGTVINSIGLDFVAVKGLYYANDSGSLDPKSVDVVAEAQQIDDSGNPVGEWFSLFPLTVVPQAQSLASKLPFVDSSNPWEPPGQTWEPFSAQVEPEPVYTTAKTYSAATNTPQRYSEKFVVPSGRYQVRVQRTSAKDTSSRAGHDFAWAGLRGYHPGAQSYGDMTMIAIRMQATSQLSSVSSRKIKVIATRKLPIWNGATWSEPVATRSISWAFAYACKSCGIPDARIDLASLLALDAIWQARGDQCNGRVDSFASLWDILTKIAAAGRAKPYLQGGVVRIFRDQSASIPVAMFTMRNIAKGSFSVEYLMPTSETADAVDVGYFDAGQWIQRRVRATLPGSSATKPVKMELSFVTSRDQAFREGMYAAACNRYRRRLITFRTEMDGFIPSFGDLIVIQHDMVAWGQGGEVIEWDGSTGLTLDREAEWEDGKAHYIGLRRHDGSMWGPVAANMGSGADRVVLASAPDFAPYLGGAKERTFWTFGWGETWGQRARVVSVQPRGLYLAEVTAVNEDANVHLAENGVTVPVPQTSGLPGITAAPAVQGLTATAMPGDSSIMLLAWEPAAWADHYVLEASPDGQTWTRIGETRTANYAATAIYGTATMIRVAAVGLKQGAWATISYADLTLSNWDPTLSALSATVTGNVVAIEWSPVLDWNVDGYELRVGSSWDDGLVIVTNLKASKFLWRPTISGSLQFWMKTINRYGVYSIDAATCQLTVEAPRVVDLTARVIDNNVLLSWAVVPGTFEAGASQVRRSIDFETSSMVGTIDGTFTVVFESVSGTYKYWVVPFDAIGLAGEPVGVYAVVNQPPDFILYDQRPLDWSGAMTNMLEDGGAVYAPINTTETFGEHFTGNGFDRPQEQVDAGLPYFLQPVPASAQYEEVIDYGAVIPSTMVTVALTRSTVTGTVTVYPELAYSLDGASWTDGAAGEYIVFASNFRYVRVRLTVNSVNNGFMVIEGSLVQLDVKKKTVRGSVLALASDVNGTAVDITGEFIDIQSIIMTPQGPSAAYAVYDFVDTGNPTEFKVYVFDASGNRVDRNVSYTIEGV